MDELLHLAQRRSAVFQSMFELFIALLQCVKLLNKHYVGGQLLLFIRELYIIS